MTDNWSNHTSTVHQSVHDAAADANTNDNEKPSLLERIHEWATTLSTAGTAAPHREHERE